MILGEAGNLRELMRRGALNHQQTVWSDYERGCSCLSALQRAVLGVITERALRKQTFASFSLETLQVINHKLEQA